MDSIHGNDAMLVGADCAHCKVYAGGAWMLEGRTDPLAIMVIGCQGMGQYGGLIISYLC